MDKLKLVELIKEELTALRGLYRAKVGDKIWIGKQGQQYKDRSEISKILPDGKLVSKDGNIFYPNGRLYKGSSLQYQKTKNPGIEISAQLATQQDFDKEYKSLKVDFLRRFNWEKMDIKDLEGIINQLPIKQANTKNTSRFVK
jgi:hypothetical protein